MRLVDLRRYRKWPSNYWSKINCIKSQRLVSKTVHFLAVSKAKMLNLKGKIIFLNKLLNLSLFPINFSWSYMHLVSSLSRTLTFPRSKGLIVGTISVDCTTLISFSSLVVISSDPSTKITCLRFHAFINILSGAESLNSDCISRNPSLVFSRTCAGLRSTIIIWTMSRSTGLVQNFAILSNFISNWYSSNIPSAGLFVKLRKMESYTSYS